MGAFMARISWVDSYKVRFAHGRVPVRRGYGIAHGSHWKLLRRPTRYCRYGSGHWTRRGSARSQVLGQAVIGGLRSFETETFVVTALGRGVRSAKRHGDWRSGSRNKSLFAGWRGESGTGIGAQRPGLSRLLTKTSANFRPGCPLASIVADLTHVVRCSKGSSGPLGPRERAN